MTNEEAIDLLDNLIGMIEDNHESDYDTALKMAIKALEQEPCEDAISRQAVDELSKELVHTTRDKADFLCNFWEGLQQLPSVNPQEPKWIPVSERLPEITINNIVSEDVLVFDGVDIRVGEYRKGKYLNGAGYWRIYGLEEYVDVIAWMPLPSPYEPQESEE